MPPPPHRPAAVRLGEQPDLSDATTDLGDKESTMLEDDSVPRSGKSAERLRGAAEAVRQWLASQTHAAPGTRG
ncbi:hypothetical protein [Alienimonas sp. DA493]|uniref:hypothetical protein n=1 Tax=Alienimonas sp. DA493 TaxID=3373605 RepID=UPI003754BBE8